MTKPTGQQIVPRELSFDLAAAMKRNRYWHRGDPVSTHFLNALQSAFPESELFFIDSARDGLDSLADDAVNPETRRNIKDFIRQEAHHGKHHRLLNQALVEAGYERIDYFDKQLEVGRKNARKKLSVRFRLALTAAAEHFTATLSRYALLKRAELISGADEPFRMLLFYHCVEEIEHKSVVFDLFQAHGGGYGLRAFTHVLGMLDVLISTRRKHRYLLEADNLWDRKTRLRTWWFIWGWRGISWQLLPGMFRYFLPGFHPWQRNEMPEITRRYAQWLEEINDTDSEHSTEALKLAS